MNIKDIKELIFTIDKTSIREIMIEEKDIKVSISKGSTTNSKEYVEINAEEYQEEELLSPKVAEKSSVDLENTYTIKSPIVGTFYGASSPDSGDYVEVGSKVKAGDILCIVEAMKIMNEIKTDIDGEIQEILVKNEDIVEYNQPLMIIRR